MTKIQSWLATHKEGLVKGLENLATPGLEDATLYTDEAYRLEVAGVSITKFPASLFSPVANSFTQVGPAGSRKYKLTLSTLWGSSTKLLAGTIHVMLVVNTSGLGDNSQVKVDTLASSSYVPCFSRRNQRVW